MDDAWPHGGEIAEAMTEKPDCGFAKDGKLVDLDELVDRLSDISGPAIKDLLKRYSSDHEWFNDYDFVARYVFGTFVDEFEDLDADSLAEVLYFTCVGPIDEQVLEKVVQEYSEPGTHHFTYKEQISLIEDWFTGELQFTEIQGKRYTLERLEQISKNLDEEIALLKSTFRFRI